MRKSIVAVTLVTLFLFVASIAAAEWPRGENVLGLYTSTDQATARANITQSAGPFSTYLVATGLTATAGVVGWECMVEWDEDASFFASQQTLYGDALNVATWPEFAVGILKPGVVPDGNGAAVLAQFDWLSFTTAQLYMHLHPNKNPSSPGNMIYVDASDVGEFIPLSWSSGDEANAVFGVNTGPLDPQVPTEDETWGSVKNMYR
jgi:hypothetical protein